MIELTPEAQAKLAERLRTPPEETPGLQVRRLFESGDQLVRFYLYTDVVEELAFASRYDGRYCAAVLTGGYGVGPERGFIEVTGFADLEYIDSLDELYSVLRPACDAVIRKADPAGDVVVGMFVGAPGSEARLDEEMARAHLTLFNVPFQPVLVLDPDSRSLALCSRGPRSTFFDAAFSVVSAA